LDPTVVFKSLDDPLYSYVFQGFYIPPRMNGGLKRYVLDGVRPGQFLEAVISNDLRESVGRADDENMRNLPAYAAFLYNYFPAGSWGSPQAMEKWIDKGGLSGAAKGEDERRAARLR